jgi:hypothetical protein
MAHHLTEQSHPARWIGELLTHPTRGGRVNVYRRKLTRIANHHQGKAMPLAERLQRVRQGLALHRRLVDHQDIETT